MLVVFPSVGFAQTTAAEVVYRNLLLQIIDSLQQQITLLKEQVAKQNIETQSVAPESIGSFRETVDAIALYEIKNAADTKLVTNQVHRAYFDRVFALFPTAYDQKIIQVIVFDGETSPYDAFVETVPPQHEKWLYAVSNDIIDDPLAEWNTELIIHELAHLVAYETILNVPKYTYICEAYFLRHGCPTSDSYLRAYVRTFWSVADLQRADHFAIATEAAGEYFAHHQTEFVSEYAATSPEEDFAESFMHFMLGKSVTGKVAQEKITFFAQYKKFSTLREVLNQAQ